MAFLMWAAVGAVLGVSLCLALRLCMARRSAQRRTLAVDVARLAQLKLDDVELVCGSEMPSWISFPEFERTRWINMQLKEIWPFVNKAASMVIRESVEPVLEQYRPLGISAIKFSKLTLGDISPQIGGIKISKEKASQLVLEVQLKWGGEPKIVLGVWPALSPAALTIQLADLQVFATARIVLEMTGKIPCVAALVAALLAEPKPKISYKLKLLGGSLAAIPGLTSLIEELVESSVNDTVVWPKRIVVPIVPGYPTEHLELRIEGALTVEVVCANKLKNSDIIGKSDPYVTLWTRPLFRQKTSVVDNDLNPVWNETFVLQVEEFYSAVLAIKVQDENNLMDVLLGYAEYTLDELPVDTVVEKTLWLRPGVHDEDHPRNRDIGCGSITLKMKYHPYTPEEQVAAMAADKLTRKAREDAGVLGSATATASAVVSFGARGVGTAVGGVGTVVGGVGSGVGSAAKLGLGGLSSVVRFGAAAARGRSAPRKVAVSPSAAASPAATPRTLVSPSATPRALTSSGTLSATASPRAAAIASRHS